MDLNYARTLTDGGIGFRYETKITALFALRLNNYFVDFYLASNFRSAGKFDDVVFALEHEGEWRTWFIQLKHRLPSTLEKKKITVSALKSKGDLVLKQYFDSYKEIAKKFENGGRDPIFGKSFSQARFGIFTNAILHEEIAGRKHDSVECEFLSTNPGVEQNIMLDISEDKDIFEKMASDWYISDFVSRLFLFTRQACEDELDTLIQSEIRLAVNTPNAAQLKLITHEWLAFIQARALSGRHLVKEEVQRNLARLVRDAQHGKRNDVSIKFVTTFLKNEIDLLAKECLIYIQCEIDTTMMVMSAFNQMGLMDEPNLSENLRSLEDNEDMQHIMAKWLSMDDISLVVDCEGDNLGVNIDKVAIFVRSLIESKKTNRVVFVSTKNNITAANLAEILQARKRRFNCTLKSLTDESKAMLKEKDVEFQGYKTTLGSLIPNPGNGPTLDDVFDMAAITQLLQGRLVQVGLKPIEQIPYYVTRVLTRQAMVNQTLFTSPDITAVYALSGITLNDAEVMFNYSPDVISSSKILATDHLVNAKVVILEGDAVKEFQNLSQSVVMPLHWFERSKKDKKLWQWQKSTRNVMDITPRLIAMRDFVTTDNIMTMRDKVVVITAEPGMGKSTLLVHLAAETKKICPHLWVICLALNDYTDHLENKDFISNIKANTKNLIAAAAGVDKETSKFNTRLFNQCYDVTGDMIVLLDGFDEITPYYTQQGLAMIKALEDSSIDRVWVTARPVLRETLEQITSTISYTIKPFVVKDQRMFMRKYWKHQLPKMDDTQLNEFVERVLTLVNNSFDKKLAQFTGIPLQTRMVAEVFTEEIKRFYETGDLVLNKTVNGVQLFDDFVRIKRGVQMEKSKIPLNANTRWEQERLNEQREEELMKLALLTLLPATICAQLTPSITEYTVTQLRELVTNGNEKSGLVLNFKGESPQFIHRTFAEYFVALYFSKNYKGNKEFMSTDTFFLLPFKIVRYFFDNMLAVGCKLHEAVLHHDVEAVQAALIEGIDVNSTDAGGRTALHLAAASSDVEGIMELLFQAGAVIDIYDAVLEGNPVDYAIKMNIIENVAPLVELTDGAVIGAKTPITWTNLQLSIKGDYLRLFQHLVSNGIMNVESFAKLTPQKWINNAVCHGLTILHIIAEFNAMKILHYLLSDEDTKANLLALVNTMSGRGVTPLLQAAVAGHNSMVYALLNIGADPMLPDRDGKNLATLAIEAQDLNLLFEIHSAVIARGQLPSSYLPTILTLLMADKSEWACNTLDLIYDMFPDFLSIRTTKNTSLLVAACIKGNHKIVRKLWEMGADVNETTTLGSPLHYAVVGGHEETVQQLLACPRLVVDKVDREGFTPLYKATLKGYQNIFQMLLGARANLNINSTSGNDFTHAVAESCDESIFRYLNEKNLNFLKKNNAGKTGLDKLIDNKAFNLVQLLDPCFVIPVENSAGLNDDNSSVMAKKVRGRPNNPLPIIKKYADNLPTSANIESTIPSLVDLEATNPRVQKSPNKRPQPPMTINAKVPACVPEFATPTLGQSSFMKITSNKTYSSQNRSGSLSPTNSEPLYNGNQRFQNDFEHKGRGSDKYAMKHKQPTAVYPDSRGRGGGNRGNRASSQDRPNNFKMNADVMQSRRSKEFFGQPQNLQQNQHLEPKHQLRSQQPQPNQQWAQKHQPNDQWSQQQNQQWDQRPQQNQQWTQKPQQNQQWAQKHQPNDQWSPQQNQQRDQRPQQNQQWTQKPQQNLQWAQKHQPNDQWSPQQNQQCDGRPQQNQQWAQKPQQNDQWSQQQNQQWDRRPQQNQQWAQKPQQNDQWSQQQNQQCDRRPQQNQQWPQQQNHQWDRRPQQNQPLRQRDQNWSQQSHYNPQCKPPHEQNHRGRQQNREMNDFKQPTLRSVEKTAHNWQRSQNQPFQQNQPPMQRDQNWSQQSHHNPQWKPPRQFNERHEQNHRGRQQNHEMDDFKQPTLRPVENTAQNSQRSQNVSNSSRPEDHNYTREGDEDKACTLM